MYPPPITSRVFGKVSRAKAPVEFIIRGESTCKGGMVAGVDPVARMHLSKLRVEVEPSLSSTLTSLELVKVARPWTKVILRAPQS